MDDGATGSKRKRQQTHGRFRGKFLTLKLDQKFDDKEFLVVSLRVSVKLKALPVAWQNSLDPVVRLMNKEGWNKVELPLAEDDLPFVNGGIEIDRFLQDLSCREIREAAKSVVWHLRCLAKFEAKRDTIRVLIDRMSLIDTVIAEREEKLQKIRDQRGESQRQMNKLVIEAAELSADLETTFDLPSHYERDRESARLPRGRHRKVRAAK